MDWEDSKKKGILREKKSHSLSTKRKNIDLSFGSVREKAV